MGRPDHAGGVVLLHLSRGRGVTAPTPVAQRIEVVGLRGGKEQAKVRGDLHWCWFDRSSRLSEYKQVRRRLFRQSSGVSGHGIERLHSSEEG